MRYEIILYSQQKEWEFEWHIQRLIFQARAELLRIRLKQQSEVFLRATKALNQVGMAAAKAGSEFAKTASIVVSPIGQLIFCTFQLSELKIRFRVVRFLHPRFYILLARIRKAERDLKRGENGTLE